MIIKKSTLPMTISFGKRGRSKNSRDNFIKFVYEGSDLLLEVNPPKFVLNGNVRTMAVGVALLISDTAVALTRDDIVADFFWFSKDGKIHGWKITDNFDEVKKFVETYNKIYEVVSLLK